MSIGLDGSLLAHVEHTESLRASSETSSLNLFRQMRASRKAETPSSLRVKLSSAMTPRVVQMLMNIFSSCLKTVVKSMSLT